MNYLLNHFVEIVSSKHWILKIKSRATELKSKANSSSKKILGTYLGKPIEWWCMLTQQLQHGNLSGMLLLVLAASLPSQFPANGLAAKGGVIYYASSNLVGHPPRLGLWFKCSLKIGRTVVAFPFLFLYFPWLWLSNKHAS